MIEAQSSRVLKYRGNVAEFCPFCRGITVMAALIPRAARNEDCVCQCLSCGGFRPSTVHNYVGLAANDERDLLVVAGSTSPGIFESWRERLVIEDGLHDGRELVPEARSAAIDEVLAQTAWIWSARRDLPIAIPTKVRARHLIPAAATFVGLMLSVAVVVGLAMAFPDATWATLFSLVATFSGMAGFGAGLWAITRSEGRWIAQEVLEPLAAASLHVFDPKLEELVSIEDGWRKLGRGWPKPMSAARIIERNTPGQGEASPQPTTSSEMSAHPEVS